MAQLGDKIKILFVTVPVYDYLADSLLIGFREIYGQNCVEFPRKDIMYGDVPSVYGRGFTIWSQPIQDVPRTPAVFEDVDLVIYSNYRRQKPIDWCVLVKNKTRAPRVVYLDGNDDNNLEPEVRPFFKRELSKALPGIFPIGFAIPERHIRPLEIEKKTQLHQSHVQDTDIASDTGYKFSEEKDYYDDMARSLFGITMKKGGWDCMRHYELLAAGALVMFKNLDDKPSLCAPQCPHFISYTGKADFMAKTARLLGPDGRPNAEYVRILEAQRSWLLENATCTARARNLMRQIDEYFQGQPAEPMPRLHFKALRRLRIEIFLFKERWMLWMITFVRQHPFADWFYYKVFKRIPGVGLFVSRVLMKEQPNAPGKSDAA